MILWTIRHTKPFNPKDICYGRLDLDVSPSFPEEYPPVLEALTKANVAPVKIFSSPLQRSYKLAQKVGEFLNQPVEKAEEIIEVNFGSWEGQKLNETPREEMAAWKADLRGYKFKNGESFHEVDDRMDKLLHKNFEDFPNTEVMWVSHAGIIASVMHRYCGVPDNDFVEGRFHYAMVTRFEFDKVDGKLVCKKMENIFDGLPMKPLDVAG